MSSTYFCQAKLYGHVATGSSWCSMIALDIAFCIHRRAAMTERRLTIIPREVRAYLVVHPPQTRGSHSRSARTQGHRFASHFFPFFAAQLQPFHCLAPAIIFWVGLQGIEGRPGHTFDIASAVGRAVRVISEALALRLSVTRPCVATRLFPELGMRRGVKTKFEAHARFEIIRIIVCSHE